MSPSNNRIHSASVATLVCILVVVQLVVSQPAPAPNANDTGLLYDLWNSLTTVGKTSTCPGECLHAITSLFCDKVLEEISCGESTLRCCVSQQLSYATPVETSPPITSTESSAETFSVISNNHNSSLTTTTSSSQPDLSTIISWAQEPVSTIVTSATTNVQLESESTTSNSIDLHYMRPLRNESEPETSRNSFRICPVPCSRPALNAFCVKPMRNVVCDSAEEECCLERESTLDTMTKNLIKLVQQSVALNETKNIGSELSALSSTTTETPTTLLPACKGTCVVSLFSLLCDDVDSSQYCPNGGSCCVNREPTTSAPQITACDGKCIPVVLSGMCNKPFELVLKTLDCISGTICCADRKTETSDDPANEESMHSHVPLEADRLPGQPPFITRPAIRPLHPPAQIMPNQFSYKPNSFLPNQNPMPIPPMHPMPIKPKPHFPHRSKPTGVELLNPNFHSNPTHTPMPDQPPLGSQLGAESGNNKVHIRPHFDSGEANPTEDKKLLLPTSKHPCPGNCMNSMFRFACFGASSIFPGFQCQKGQVCCAPITEIEKYEAFLQSNSQSTFPQVHESKPSLQAKPAMSHIEPIVDISTSPHPEPSPYVCGVKGGRNRSKRVVGGSETQPGEFCWQVALVNQHNKYMCGGALIGKQWVLTAAHCISNLVRKNEPIFVRIGEHDIKSSRLGQKVVTTYIHHNHNGQSLDNNIALLKLQSPVELNQNTCLVCLPTRSTKKSQNKRCTVTGYGFAQESGPNALRIRQALVPIVEDQECTARINSVTERLFILPASSFCAGGEGGNDACQGDGGSGLVCESEGFYELTGLVSWGFGCGRNGVPGVYVKVISFVGWINQIVSTNSN